MAKRKTASKPSSAKKKAAPKKKASRQTRAKDTSSAKAGEKAVTIDRRRKERRKSPKAGAGAAEATPAKTPKLERRQKVNRRRQIDPTTCERDYSDAEVEFMNALDEYKRKSGRQFPTCSEVLEVIRDLGYVKLSPAELAARGGPEDDDLESRAEADATDALRESEALQHPHANA